MESSSRIWRLFTTIMGFTSLVPDVLSLGHWENKGEINKFTENYGLKQTQKLLSRFTQYQTWTLLGFFAQLSLRLSLWVYDQ